MFVPQTVFTKSSGHRCRKDKSSFLYAGRLKSQVLLSYSLRQIRICDSALKSQVILATISATNPFAEDTSHGCQFAGSRSHGKQSLGCMMQHLKRQANEQRPMASLVQKGAGMTCTLKQSVNHSESVIVD